MLTSALKALTNNLFQESFDTTFMRNEKSCQNINQYSKDIRSLLLTNAVREFVSISLTKNLICVI